MSDIVQLYSDKDKIIKAYPKTLASETYMSGGGTVESQLEQIKSEKYDKVTLYENVLKFYANEVELTSIKLPSYEGSGQNAREIELQKSETHIQWRYVGEEVWKDLVALNDIKGDAGAKGDKGDRGLPISISLNGTNYSQLDGIITLPNYSTKLSQLTNDANFITLQDIDTSQNHTHTNKLTLDKITEPKIISWDNKSNFSGSYNDLTNKPTIPSKVSQLTNDVGYITAADVDASSNHVHANKTTLDTITDSKVTNWDAAYTHSQTAHNYAPSTHDHNASQVTKMTGYAKPSSTSSIATTDSLNTAIGKLEKALDGKQASGSYAPASHVSDTVAHITADERSKWNAKSNLALGTTSTTAFRGDQGLTAYNHSQVAHAPANAEQNVQSDWNEINTGSDAYIKNKPAIHNHTNKETLDTITQGNINKWNSALNLTEMEVYGGNVDTQTTPGYYLTNGDNTGLPPECNDRWNRTGLLYIISANKNDGKCIQTYYPLDGATNGNIYWRAVFPNDIKEWKKVSNFSGSYGDLTNIPATFTPTSHNHPATEITTDTNHQFVTEQEKVKWTNTVGGYKVWVGTQVEYDGITTKDSNTLYFIKEG